MTLTEVRELLASGKPIQWRAIDSTSTWRDFAECGDAQFIGPSGNYRLKPDPELRQWKPGEAKLFAWYRYRDCLEPKLFRPISFPVAVGHDGVTFVPRSGPGTQISWKSLFDLCEYSIDGLIWHRCGAIES